MRRLGVGAVGLVVLITVAGCSAPDPTGDDVARAGVESAVDRLAAGLASPSLADRSVPYRIAWLASLQVDQEVTTTPVLATSSGLIVVRVDVEVSERPWWFDQPSYEAGSATVCEAFRPQRHERIECPDVAAPVTVTAPIHTDLPSGSYQRLTELLDATSAETFSSDAEAAFGDQPVTLETFVSGFTDLVVAVGDPNGIECLVGARALDGTVHVQEAWTTLPGEIPNVPCDRNLYFEYERRVFR